jgi:hypothetical protein
MLLPVLNLLCHNADRTAMLRSHSTATTPTATTPTTTTTTTTQSLKMIQVKQTQRSRVIFLTLPDFLSSGVSGTGSTQPPEDK